jgi:hypothetical protein
VFGLTQHLSDTLAAIPGIKLSHYVQFLKPNSGILTTASFSIIFNSLITLLLDGM